MKTNQKCKICGKISGSSSDICFSCYGKISSIAKKIREKFWQNPNNKYKYICMRTPINNTIKYVIREMMINKSSQNSEKLKGG